MRYPQVERQLQLSPKGNPTTQAPVSFRSFSFPDESMLHTNVALQAAEATMRAEEAAAAATAMQAMAKQATANAAAKEVAARTAEEQEVSLLIRRTIVFPPSFDAGREKRKCDSWGENWQANGTCG